MSISRKLAIRRGAEQLAKDVAVEGKGGRATRPHANDQSDSATRLSVQDALELS